MADSNDFLNGRIDKINSISNCFCTAKWLQTTLYLQNGFNHSCHHPAPHKIPLEELSQNISALNNSAHKKQQRRLMLDGIRPDECSYCWKIEDLNSKVLSDRYIKTRAPWGWYRFDEISQSEPNKDVYPSYLEVSFSNACNLKCSYCNPTQSSKWLEEIKQHGPYPTTGRHNNLEYYKEQGQLPYKHNEYNPYIDAFWKWFPEALKFLKVFRITGGEPLMSKDTWKLFDYLRGKDLKYLEFYINTNLAVEDKLIDRLVEEAKDIQKTVGKFGIFTSLESTGTQAEYVRYGLNFDKFKSNLKRMSTEIDCDISIMTTINVLSLPKLKDFINLITNLQIENKKQIAYHFNILHYPRFLSCKILDQTERQKYADIILETMEQSNSLLIKNKLPINPVLTNGAKRFCEWLTKDEVIPDGLSDFQSFIIEQDKRRNTNFKETFPELAFLLD